MANNEQDQLWVYNPTATAFSVKWGGYPYTLESGEKKVFPRFIAEHFAKHLADAILLHREQVMQEKTGKPVALVNNPVERPKIVGLILLGVYSYFHGDPNSAAASVANAVDQINQSADAANAPAPSDVDQTVYDDYGLVPNRAIGNLAAPEAPDTSDLTNPPSIPEETAVNSGALIDESDVPAPGDVPGAVGGTKPKRTRQELLAEAERLGIENARRMTTPNLELAIKNF